MSVALDRDVLLPVLAAVSGLVLPRRKASHDSCDMPHSTVNSSAHELMIVMQSELHSRMMATARNPLSYTCISRQDNGHKFAGPQGHKRAGKRPSNKRAAPNTHIGLHAPQDELRPWLLEGSASPVSPGGKRQLPHLTHNTDGISARSQGQQRKSLKWP